MKKAFLHYLISSCFLLACCITLIVWPWRSISEKDFEGLKANIENGAYIYNAAGCHSCHLDENKSEDPHLLAGGHILKSDFGNFIVPNISPHPIAGIGNWTRLEFATALVDGVSPKGQHYYPAFPYTSYAQMSKQDIVDLFAYIKTLPEISTPTPSSDIKFPFNIRLGLGPWKLFFHSKQGRNSGLNNEISLERGAYIVEALAHCGECHTPRSVNGSLIHNKAYSGVNSAQGRGAIPNITPHENGIGSWSEEEIVEYLASGFTPEFDSAGGNMASVIEKTSKLTEEDIKSIALYLKSLRPLP